LDLISFEFSSHDMYIGIEHQQSKMEERDW